MKKWVNCPKVKSVVSKLNTVKYSGYNLNVTDAFFDDLMKLKVELMQTCICVSQVTVGKN